MKFLIKCFWYFEAANTIIMLSGATVAVTANNIPTRLGAVLISLIAMYFFAGGLAVIKPK